MPDLNPDQFFHGTTAAIKDGMVRPVNDVPGKAVSEYSMGDPGDMSEGDHAFVTTDEHHAWRIANTIHPSLRRSRVYETGGASDMKPGPWNKDHPNFLEHNELDVAESWLEHPANKRAHEAEVAKAEADSLPEYGSKTGFPVRKRIDIMPGHQGTFPDIAWGRFSNTPYSQSINHPNDEMVKYGHTGLERTQRDAIKMDAEITEARAPKRSGRSLRAFLSGQPEPGPLADHPHLF